MVASRQVKIPYYRNIGRQRGKGFIPLAYIFGRTTFPVLRQYIVPAAKCVGTDLMEHAAQKVAKSVNVTNKFEGSAKGVGRQTLKKHLGSGGQQQRVIPRKSTKQTSWSRRHISTKT